MNLSKIIQFIEQSIPNCFTADSDIRICGLSELKCFYNVYWIFQIGLEKNDEIEKCKCLPKCNSIEYDIQVVRTHQKYDDMYQYFENNQSYNYLGSNYYGGVRISFSDTEFTALKQYVNYGTISFLSNAGGLLSLFLGISVLSLIEVFYFLIRAVVDLLKFFRFKKTAKVQNAQIDLTRGLQEIA